MESSIDRCRMSVKGVAGATYGRFAKDREGTIRSFCINRSQAYTMLYQHVKKCPECRPDDVLRALLDLRKADHLGGIVSGGLTELAVKMGRIRGGESVSHGLMREFVWRQGNVNDLVYGRGGVDASECVKGLALLFAHERWKCAKDDPSKGCGVRRRFSAKDFVNGAMKGIHYSAARFCQIARTAAAVFDRDGSVSPECDELRDLCTVADVLCA